MGNGATYWGNAEGRNDECDNKSGRPNQYPGSQAKADMKGAADGTAPDSTKVPMENC